jgi:outer membrane protein W
MFMNRPVVASVSFTALLFAGVASAQDGPGAAEPAAVDSAATPGSGPAEATPSDVRAEVNPSVAPSVDAAPGRFVIGLRLGYALPMGSAAKNDKMSDNASGMIPIWLDLGYMISPNIMFGAYGQYGLVSLKNCNGDCSARDLRLGLQGQYHFSPTEKFDPWFGLGIGYEKLSSTRSGRDESLGGFEFVNLHAGMDYKVSPALGVGPFISFSLGQYSSASAGDISVDIPEKALHQWLTLGIRGAFTL